MFIYRHWSLEYGLFMADLDSIVTHGGWRTGEGNAVHCHPGTVASCSHHSHEGLSDVGRSCHLNLQGHVNKDNR